MDTNFTCTNCKKGVIGHMYRGLCWKCYKTCLGMVNRGETTWKELEVQGKSLPKKNNFFKKLEDRIHEEYTNRD